MFFRKKRPLETRERLAALADTTIVSLAGIFALSAVLNIGINVSGMIFPRVFDPVSAIGRGMSPGTALAEIAVFHSMMGASLLASAAVGILAMVAMILSWGFKTRGLASVGCSCAVLMAMATPLPKYLVAAYLAADWQPWAVVPGAGAALESAILSPDIGSPAYLGFNPFMIVAVAGLSWYRIALSSSSMRGLRFVPRSLRPVDV